MSDGRHGIRMVVAYDGRGFHGFQRQPGQRTVQDVLAEAIRALDPEASAPRGSSRTDAGVHARGQVVAFDAVRALPPKGWRMQLNTRLPDDLAIRSVDECAPRYEPRFDAIEKEYRYRVHVGESRDPLRDPFSWHVDPSLGRPVPGSRREHVDDYLDVGAMREAAAHLVGTHDFRAFRSADDARPNSVRTVHSIRIATPFGGEDDALAVDVVGNAFMKNMVRILVGTLVDVGRGKRAPASMLALLGANARREDAGRTAPANGLCLQRVLLGRGELSRAAETS